MPRLLIALLGLSLSMALCPVSAQETVSVSDFAAEGLKDWRSRAFKGETAYTLMSDPETNSVVLKAVSAGSASGRFRRMKIDLRRTPFLNWSWKVVNIFPDIDETKKTGDDFPARIFVVVERGAFGAGSEALNYVWSSRQPVGSLWPSPYSDRVRLLAVDSGTGELDRWVSHKRDLRSDLNAAFGADVTEIDGVALMTDTDNHGGTAEAYFGDIWFSAE